MVCVVCVVWVFRGGALFARPGRAAISRDHWRRASLERPHLEDLAKVLRLAVHIQPHVLPQRNVAAPHEGEVAGLLGQVAVQVALRHVLVLGGRAGKGPAPPCTPPCTTTRWPHHALDQSHRDPARQRLSESHVDPVCFNLPDSGSVNRLLSLPISWEAQQASHVPSDSASGGSVRLALPKGYNLGLQQQALLNAIGLIQLGPGARSAGAGWCGRRPWRFAPTRRRPVRPRASGAAGQH